MTDSAFASPQQLRDSHQLVLLRHQAIGEKAKQLLSTQDGMSDLMADYAQDPDVLRALLAAVRENDELARVLGLKALAMAEILVRDRTEDDL